MDLRLKKFSSPLQVTAEQIQASFLVQIVRQSLTEENLLVNDDKPQLLSKQGVFVFTVTSKPCAG